MRARRALVLVALLAFASPVARAHAGPIEDVYDPLLFDLHLYLSADGLALDEPSDGPVAFPAGVEPAPLELDALAPFAFANQRGIDLRFWVESTVPLAAQDADGESFDITLLRGGEPIDGAATTASVGPLLTTGTPAEARASLTPAALEAAQGERLTLRIAPRFAVPSDGALLLLVGGPAASKLDFQAVRLPSLSALDPQSGGLVMWDLARERFVPSDTSARVAELRVDHARVDGAPFAVAKDAPLWIALLGAEPQNDAERHHEQPREDERLAKAHAFAVGPLGTLARVHPGVGTAVRVPTDRAGTWEVRCVMTCPEGGFVLRYDVEDASASATPETPRSALIPPSRQTLPPVDELEAGKEETPGLAPAALVALAGMALALRKRRG